MDIHLEALGRVGALGGDRRDAVLLVGPRALQLDLAVRDDIGRVVAAIFAGADPARELLGVGGLQALGLAADRNDADLVVVLPVAGQNRRLRGGARGGLGQAEAGEGCLLYTSDAADE